MLKKKVCITKKLADLNFQLFIANRFDDVRKYSR